ncbi:hypothetical protein [Pararobbsia silviterrae]|uniref:Uncharacterized protein n=1 Tax=Pararobbsia silviterrae TaxID=1792498 RepID=A0A494Y7R4_9BURK|nr:hypothetical protein [Pararobbsia silviterrae]RKP56366.1 hypothetical protein D7S86_08175 [Pararobbsia silviterrae]
MGWQTQSPWRPLAGKGQNLTLGSASVASTAFADNVQAVQISATGNCHVAVGVTPTALTTDMLVKATDNPQLVRVAPGEKIAVIQDGTSTGTLNVIEVTH